MRQSVRLCIALSLSGRGFAGEVLLFSRRGVSANDFWPCQLSSGRLGNEDDAARWLMRRMHAMPLPAHTGAKLFGPAGQIVIELRRVCRQVLFVLEAPARVATSGRLIT